MSTMNDDDDDDFDGHYEITAYQHSGKVTFVTKVKERGTQYGVYVRDGEEICLPGKDPQKGDWYWHANDGALDTGPFRTRNAAVSHARKYLKFCRDMMGGKVLSVTEIP